MTNKSGERGFAILRADNIEFKIRQINLKLIVKVKIGRGKRRLRFQPVTSNYNENLPRDSHILNIQREGKEITEPFLISSTENILINNELLTKGSERILLHGDAIEYEKDIVIIFEDQRKLLADEFPRDISEEFYASKQFNNGLTKTVFIVQSVREPRKKFVLKEIINNDDGSIAKEAELMAKLKHSNIVNLIKIFKYDLKSYLLIEFMEDIDLLVRITKAPKVRLTECDAKFCFYQIVQGIKYMHDLNIAHSDIKPENVFVREVNGKPLCKLGDLGLSNYDNGIGDLGGTLLYSAPENLIKNAKNYSSKRADMWSLGVLLFCMLSGKWPFHAPSTSGIRLLIDKGEFSFKSDFWKTVSGDALKLISALIRVDPMLRFTAEEVLNHKWFDDSQLMKDISIMKSTIELNHQNTQDENTLISIARTIQSESPPTVDKKKKRKLPFSVPQLFNGKRRKA